MLNREIFILTFLYRSEAKVKTMIRLTFLLNQEVLRFKVQGKEIWYADRIWKGGVRCIPKDAEFIRQIINSRNKYPMTLIKMFNLPESDRLEYERAASLGEEALAEAVTKDCLAKGLRLLKKEEEKDAATVIS